MREVRRSFQLQRGYRGEPYAVGSVKKGDVSPIFGFMAKEMLLPICTVHVPVALPVW
jgi:hypothetical protein